MRVGRLRDGAVVLIEGDGARKLPGTVLEYLGGRTPDPMGEHLEVPSLTFASPIERPGKVIGIGLNYADHAAKLGRELPDKPLMFLKASTCITGDGDPIVVPYPEAQVDYEVELAVVIGTRAKNVAVAEAASAIGGFSCFNDVSDRNAQWGDGQWTRGKSFDSFGPCGPIVVTPDEIADPMKLAVTTHVNAEIRQSSLTSNMIFDVYELVSYCSRAFTLERGDIICTGTPAGVAAESGEFLRPGDTVTVSVEGIGSLTNAVVG